MGNATFAPVLGRGTAILSLNGKSILVHNVLHVPDLHVPLYSLRAHLTQLGCGFIGDYDTGFYVYFPAFVLEVNSDTDSHLTYSPLGSSVTLSSLAYAQPKPPVLAHASSLSTPPMGPTSTTLHVIPKDVVDSPTSTRPAVPSLPLPRPSSPNDSTPKVRLLSTMTRDEITQHLHTPDAVLPAIRPCDTPNGSDTKMHWSAEELHRITGCRKFKNYEHLLQVSKDGVWVEAGESPASIGDFATIPKSRRGGIIDRTNYKYLDVVHLDFVFGDNVAVGGFRYALIFVDQATRYAWVFGLKALSSDEILAAFLAFRSEAGRFARCFRCDCDRKLVGNTIKLHLQRQGSDIISAPAGRQSSNGLVERNWQTMIHMSRAYLTETQMPKNFWYFSVKHAARMMNMIPGKYKGKLASPFMLVYGVPPDERTWFPLFSLCYFHHDKDGAISRSTNQAQTMDGIAVGRSPTSNALLVYNPHNKCF
jgi:hypothetical protein